MVVPSCEMEGIESIPVIPRTDLSFKRFPAVKSATADDSRDTVPPVV